MPEEIFKDLKGEGTALKEEDIMWPEPSPEQKALWEELEKIIIEKILEREGLFKILPKAVKDLLASEYTSSKLAEISRKYNLTNDQTMALSRYIKSLFITFPKEQEVEVSKLTNLLRLDLDISLEKAQGLFQNINNEILLPALKDVLTEGVSEESTKPENDNSNIVDLKKLSRE